MSTHIHTHVFRRFVFSGNKTTQERKDKKHRDEKKNVHNMISNNNKKINQLMIH